MEAQRIIITGGATRIGAAIAKQLSGTNKEILIHFNKSKSSKSKISLRWFRDTAIQLWGGINGQ